MHIPDHLQPESASSLSESMDGMTLQTAQILIPDLLKMCNPSYVADMVEKDLELRIKNIDRLLEGKNASKELRGVLSAARGRILEVAAKRME